MCVCLCVEGDHQKREIKAKGKQKKKKPRKMLRTCVCLRFRLLFSDLSCACLSSSYPCTQRKEIKKKTKGRAWWANSTRSHCTDKGRVQTLEAKQVTASQRILHQRTEFKSLMSCDSDSCSADDSVVGTSPGTGNASGTLNTFRKQYSWGHCRQGPQQ